MSEETRKTIRHLPEMVEEINWRLDKEKLTPPIPDGHKKSNALRRQEFLQIAIENFGWDENTVTNTWPDDEGTAPGELTQGNAIEETMYREYYERKDAPPCLLPAGDQRVPGILPWTAVAETRQDHSRRQLRLGVGLR